MSVPVNLEIFMTDLTRAGLSSVSKNVGDAEGQARQLIAALEEVRAGYQRILEANRRAGQSYAQEEANVQALTGQINGLKEGLKELEAAKQQVGATPMVDADAVSRKMGNLRMQFQQVARELPSLAMGPQMFILAISNNLPMLADAIADVRKQNELLKASGQKSVPVWKQLGSTLLSWQTALAAGISLLIVYGKDIAAWAGNLFKAKSSVESLDKQMKNVNETLKSNNASYGENVAALKSLADEWGKLSGKASKVKWIEENKSEFDKLGISIGDVSDAETAFVNNTDDIIEAFKLRAQAAAAQTLAEEKYREAMVKRNEADLEAAKGPSASDRGKASFMGNMPTGGGIARMPQTTSYQEDAERAEEIRKKRIQGMYDEADAVEDAGDAYFRLAEAKKSESGKILSGLGVGSGNEDEEGNGQAVSKLKSYLEELARLRLDNEDRQVDLMAEGTDKELAEINLRYKRIRDKVKELEADLAREQGGKLTKEQKDLFKDAYKGIDAQLARDAESAAKARLEAGREAMDRYLSEYGTFLEKRDAVTRQYNQKIAEAVTEGDKLSLRKQMEDALKELDFSQFKSTIDWADVFGNLDEQTTESLTTLRDKLGDYINEAASELRPEDLKELQDSFKKIDFELTGRAPFQELKSGLDEYKEAQSEVAKAQEDLNAVLSGGEVVTGIYEDATGKLTKRLLTQEEAERRLREAQESRQGTLAKLGRAANAIGSQGMEVVNAGREIAGMLETFGVQVPEAVSGVLDGVGQVMSSLESIDVTKPFSILSGAIGTITGIGQTIASLFSLGGPDYSGYEDMKSQYENLISVWDELIGKKMEYIDIDYGIEAQKAADEAARLVEAQIVRQRQLARTLAESGSSAWTHSMGYRVNDNMGREDWERLSGLVGQQVGSIYDVLNLDADVIGKALEDEKFVSVLTGVNTEFIDYIQNIADYAGQLGEIAEKEKEAVTGIGFDSFKESYVDMLSDLTSTNEDFADNLEKNLQNAILRSLIADKYADAIQGLYDSWTSSGADGLTPEEAEALRKQQQDIVDQMLADREALMEDFGWTAESAGSSQSPQSGALTTMTQDSISAFEGIGRSLQTHVISLDKVTQELRDQGRADSESLMQIVNNTSYLLPIYELIERMDRDGIKIQ